MSSGQARILVFSMRNITRHVARCSGYEFEDMIVEMDAAELLAPSPPRDTESRLRRYVRSAVFGDAPRVDGEVVVTKKYDLFFAFCMNSRDLAYLDLVQGLHENCRKSVCAIGEMWPSAIEANRDGLRALRRFDHIFSAIESSVEMIREITGRPCSFMPFGVGAERFCPLPQAPARRIDVCNIGRRYPGVHEALKSVADCDDLLYLYDTVGDFSVLDVRDHRRLLASMIKRSRYFIAYPPKFDRPAETGGLAAIGARYFEGAAGGAVMVGMSSRCASFDRCFDWPDAVIPADPDGGDIRQVIAQLDADPERVQRIRKTGIIACLERHDWVYRWRDVLAVAGLPATPRMAEREARLQRLAVDVAGNGTLR
jgi:hypothetical protein